MRNLGLWTDPWIPIWETRRTALQSDNRHTNRLNNTATLATSAARYDTWDLSQQENRKQYLENYLQNWNHIPLRLYPELLMFPCLVLLKNTMILFKPRDKREDMVFA